MNFQFLRERSQLDVVVVVMKLFTDRFFDWIPNDCHCTVIEFIVIWMVVVGSRLGKIR